MCILGTAPLEISIPVIDSVLYISHMLFWLCQVAVSEAGELKEELKTLKAEYQACQSRYEEERARLENGVTTLGEKLASLEKISQTEREEKVKLEKELRKVHLYSTTDVYILILLITEGSKNVFLHLCL